MHLLLIHIHGIHAEGNLTKITLYIYGMVACWPCLNSGETRRVKPPVL